MLTGSDKGDGGGEWVLECKYDIDFSMLISIINEKKNKLCACVLCVNAACISYKSSVI